MEVKEAIERIKNRYMTVSMCINSAECKAENEAIDIAVSALEKRIPKKPTYTFLGGEYGCPICAWSVSSCFDGYIERKMKYCSYCGQKIDWSVTE